MTRFTKFGKNTTEGKYRKSLHEQFVNGYYSLTPTGCGNPIKFMKLGADYKKKSRFSRF